MISHTVNVPPGYEAIVCFNVDSKSWYPYFRKIGATFWTKCRPFGHGHTPTNEIVQTAEEIVSASILY